MLSLLNLAARAVAKKLPIAVESSGSGEGIYEALEPDVAIDVSDPSTNANAHANAPTSVTSNRKTAWSLPLATIETEFFRTPQPAFTPEARSTRSGMHLMATAAARSPPNVEPTGVNIQLLCLCYCSRTLHVRQPHDASFM